LIQASPSPSSSLRVATSLFGAGPLQIELVGPHGPTRQLLESTLSLYDVPWTLADTKYVRLEFKVGTATPSSGAARGDYLECAQMLVDHMEDGVRATTLRGAHMRGTFAAAGEVWQLAVPQLIDDEGWWPELEDLVSLVVTTGWRRAGWVPLHAAGLTDGRSGVVVCAGSRGGKTTFTLAMARRGWRVVGDDKLLLRRSGAGIEIAAVKHMLNVDPAAAEWFPEVGDLSGLPLYSEWSPKRRVGLATLFAGAPALAMAPTHVVALERTSGIARVHIEPMTMAETLSTLLHQTVIPTDPKLARQITSALVDVAQRSSGLRVALPDDIYAHLPALEEIEAALR
jgi:hypothetical protein